MTVRVSHGFMGAPPIVGQQQQQHVSSAWTDSNLAAAAAAARGGICPNKKYNNGICSPLLYLSSDTDHGEF